MGWIWLVLGLWVMALFAYNRAALNAFIGVGLLLLLAATLSGDAHWPSWLVAALLLLPLKIRKLRQSCLTAPLLRAFWRRLPEMSRTEREALAAGTTWWEADLFRGAPDWHKLHQYPQPRLRADEQAFLAGPVEAVCRMSCDWQISHQDADLSPELWQFLKNHGFFAMIIKKEYGGLEFSAYAQSRVLQKLMGVSPVLASTVAVPNSLGPAELLQHYGTEAQKMTTYRAWPKGWRSPVLP